MRHEISDTLVLCRAMTFDTRIFEKKTEKKDVATAVHLLLDNSGSMFEIDLAMEAVLGITSALMRIAHVNPAVSAFPGTNDRNQATTIVPHGTKVLARCAPAIGRVYATGGTPLAEGLMHVALKLAQTREPRKVVIVVTDGYPDSVPNAQAVIKRLEASGIEVYAIGIGSNCGVDCVFEKYATIRNIGELQGALFEIGRSVGLTAAAA